MKESIKNTMISIAICLLFIYFNYSRFISEYTRYTRMDKSFYEVESLNSLILLFMTIAIGLILLLIFFLLKSTYRHKNKMVLMNMFLIVSLGIQFTSFFILQEVNATTLRIDTLVIWLNTHDYVLAVFWIGFLMASIYIAATIYYACVYKFKSKDIYDISIPLERKQVAVFCGAILLAVVLFAMSFSIKDLLIQQEIVLNYNEDELFVPYIDGYNGQGYYNGSEDEYPRSPIQQEVLSGDQYAFEDNRQLYYLKYLMLYENIGYEDIDNKNGNYQNGDIAKLKMNLIPSTEPYNIKLEGTTTIETEVEGLPEYKYKSYEDISSEEMMVINESLNVYIDNQYTSNNPFGKGKRVESITLIKSGFYNRSENKEQQEPEDFNPHLFTAKNLLKNDAANKLFNYENKLVYLYKVTPEQYSSAYYVSISFPLNEEGFSDLKNDDLFYSPFQYTTYNENDMYDESIQWIIEEE